ncbi:MAG: hypothetical protein ABIK25_07260 [Pseudomonadota bacterium]
MLTLLDTQAVTENFLAWYENTPDVIIENNLPDALAKYIPEADMLLSPKGRAQEIVVGRILNSHQLEHIGETLAAIGASFKNTINGMLSGARLDTNGALDENSLVGDHELASSMVVIGDSLIAAANAKQAIENAQQKAKVAQVKEDKRAAFLEKQGNFKAYAHEMRLNGIMPPSTPEKVLLPNVFAETALFQVKPHGKRELVSTDGPIEFKGLVDGVRAEYSGYFLTQDDLNTLLAVLVAASGIKIAASDSQAENCDTREIQAVEFDEADMCKLLYGSYDSEGQFVGRYDTYSRRQFRESLRILAGEMDGKNTCSLKVTVKRNVRINGKWKMLDVSSTGPILHNIQWAENGAATGVYINPNLIKMYAPHLFHTTSLKDRVALGKDQYALFCHSIAAAQCYDNDPKSVKRNEFVRLVRKEEVNQKRMWEQVRESLKTLTGGSLYQGEVTSSEIVLRKK